MPSCAAPAARRKAKQSLLTDGVEMLNKKVKKGKGVNKTIIDERQARVSTGQAGGAWSPGGCASRALERVAACCGALPNSA